MTINLMPSDVDKIATLMKEFDKFKEENQKESYKLEDQMSTTDDLEDKEYYACRLDMLNENYSEESDAYYKQLGIILDCVIHASIVDGKSVFI